MYFRHKILKLYEKKEPTDDTDTDVYSQLVLCQHVSRIIMPIVRRTACDVSLQHRENVRCSVELIL